MINLILAIICSATISLLMRILDKHIKNNMTMFTANYLICCLCSVFFVLRDSGGTGFKLDSQAEGLAFAIILGLISGIFYLVSFVLLQFNIQKNGVILASTFMKLGVLVPVLMAIIFFKDAPTIMQVMGFILAIIAIVTINGKGRDNAQSVLWLIILLVVGGLTDSAANIFDKLGNSEFKNHYLLFIFLAAILSSIVGIVVKKQRFTVKDFLCGLLIGVPNYFSSRFLLGALSDLPAIVVYPVYNIAVILIISIIGVLAFKEKLGLRKMLGLVMIVGAVCLLCI